MISSHLTKIIILFTLLAFTPMTVIGSSDPQKIPTGVSIFSTGTTSTLIYETPSSLLGTDKLAHYSTYTVSTQISGSTYIGTFAGCCFYLSDEWGTCVNNPKCSAAYLTKKVSDYMKSGGPEAPSKTDPPSFIINPTKNPAPGSSSGNGMKTVLEMEGQDWTAAR
ncbi:uncharacterized protein EAF02_002499 [Botrytis sinoallii]|uniref:uncharacterized protein n=1 Tax=Botrytis sinoallii TaxID=1463999 RepID=UPI0019024869|nr:uncharacterized protein EAF02_002499 [Botrytis sinoallii]KAF7890084.1 hypothetical protein EAF02_002499 [Botrytis sinoallii]